MSFRFFAIADFGSQSDTVRKIAKAMHQYAIKNSTPNIILGLGDNFYPSGVSSVSDPLFSSCWADIFLKYDTLRVPWKMILGNHDYMDNPMAQIDFHHSELNPSKLWHMPSKCYSFQSNQLLSVSSRGQEDKPPWNVDFFGLDTNGVQLHVRELFPEVEEELRSNLSELAQKLEKSHAHWKIVFGHHPMYTQGVGHSTVADCLRLEDYTFKWKNSNHPGSHSTRSTAEEMVSAPGYGMERKLIDGGAHAYFCGHEHVFQYHCSSLTTSHSHQNAQKMCRTPLHHVCAGACGAEDGRGPTGLYGGPRQDIKLDWVGGGSDHGFVDVTLSQDHMVVRFVSVEGELLKQVQIPHSEIDCDGHA